MGLVARWHVGPSHTEGGFLTPGPPGKPRISCLLLDTFLAEMHMELLTTLSLYFTFCFIFFSLCSHIFKHKVLEEKIVIEKDSL